MKTGKPLAHCKRLSATIRHLEFIIEQGHRVNWVSRSLGHKMWPSSISGIDPPAGARNHPYRDTTGIERIPHNETQSPLDRRWLPASTMMSKIINRLRPPTQRDASGALMENEQVVGAVKRPVGRKSSVAKYYYYHYYLLCNSHSQKTSAYI